MSKALIEWLKRNVKGRTEGMYRLKSLEDLGLKVLSDEKLTLRLQGLYDKFQEVTTRLPRPENIYELEASEFEKYVDQLRGKLFKVREMVMLEAIPYGRALNNNAYARLTRAWENIMNYCEELIEKIREMLYEKERPTDKWTLITLLENFIRKTAWNLSNKLIAVSFTREDVAPSYAVVIQQPQLVYQGAPLRQFDAGSIGQMEETRSPPIRRPVEDEM